MAGGRDYRCDLLRNIHEGLPLPEGVMESDFVVGDYLYYHYGCDGFDDRVRWMIAAIIFFLSNVFVEVFIQTILISMNNLD